MIIFLIYISGFITTILIGYLFNKIIKSKKFKIDFWFAIFASCFSYIGAGALIIIGLVTYLSQKENTYYNKLYKGIT